MQNLVKHAALLFPFFLLFGDSSRALSQGSERQNIVAPEEREALVALYNATGGSQWINNSGWLGPPGTECEWHGITCVYPEKIQARIPSIASLELSNNKLVGVIPPELGHLKSLEWLSISSNRLTGTLPVFLIQRWLSGSLQIAAEAHLLTSVSKVDYESNASSLLCARTRIVFDSDQKAIIYTMRCLNATPDDRTTYCEVKEGQVDQAEFARLAWAIERGGFFTLQPEYTRNTTYGTFENTRVIRAGTTSEVTNYAGTGPLELWSIQRTIEGIAANIEVQQTTRRSTCPNW